MESVEKIILTQIYLSGITGKSYIDNLTKKGFSEKITNSKIDELVKNKLITEDKSALTELGRSSLRVVLAGGVFDIIHPGHIHTLNAAKILGDVLVVVVATDNTAVKMKKRQPLHSK
ncbi:MAG: cytidyltransferase, partial [Nitrosopumilales archaeon CG_4_10_14_0_8_um_filter_34_8]